MRKGGQDVRRGISPCPCVIFSSGFGESQRLHAVQVNWSAKDLANDLSPRVSGKNKKVEQMISAKYPPLSDKDMEIRQSCTIVDKDGIMLVTYLRDVLTEERQVRAFPVSEFGD